MKLNVDTVAKYVVQNHNVEFMKENDYSTASKEEAQKIQDFLSNKKARAARQEELAAYLLGMKDEQGNSLFTYKQAVEASKQQLENEISQKKAQTTKTFIDEKSYNEAVAQAKKDGTYNLYTFNLIKDKEVLNLINGNKDLYFTKDENGNEVFDSDKFKNEFGKDVGTDNKLQLKERKEAASKRGISATAEKNAIKAAGIDYRRDNTGLYRTLAGTAALAALVFGVSAATATAVAETACNTYTATATATSRLGGLIGAAAAAGTIPFIRDKDGKTNKRQDAANLYHQEPKPEPKQDEPKPAPAPAPAEPPKEPTPEPCDGPCYTMDEGVAVKTILYGGYWHYAHLYNDCDTGKPLNNKQIKELTQLLKPGHEASSLQNGDNWKTKVLRKEVTLSDGTKVCLADEKEIEKRVASMKTKAGGKNMKLGSRTITVRTCDGEYIGSASTREKAQELIKSR